MPSYVAFTGAVHSIKLTNARIETITGLTTWRDVKVVRAVTEKWGS